MFLHPIYDRATCYLDYNTGSEQISIEILLFCYGHYRLVVVSGKSINPQPEFLTVKIHSNGIKSFSHFSNLSCKIVQS